MQRYLAEAIGTFALVFAGTGAVIVDDVTGGAVTLVGVSMAFALIVTAMIYSIGDLSGAHINPAVTVAMVVARKFPLRDAGPYVLAQCLGALAASGVLWYLFPEASTLGPTLPSGSVEQSLVLEVILTFLLVFVVFNSTLDRKPEKSLAGFVIGGTVGVEVFCGGPISGASMNPARSLGPAVVGGTLEHLWIYLTAPLVGGALAALITDYLRCEHHGGGACKVTPKAEARSAEPIPEPNEAPANVRVVATPHHSDRGRDVDASTIGDATSSSI